MYVFLFIYQMTLAKMLTNYTFSLAELTIFIHFLAYISVSAIWTTFFVSLPGSNGGIKIKCEF
jgi:hypothetical protein